MSLAARRATAGRRRARLPASTTKALRIASARSRRANGLSTTSVKWFDGRHPIVVVESPGAGIVAFASTSTYRARDCYAGIAEFSVYVARAARGLGAGRVAMERLIARGRAHAGFWKLVSRVFVENTASRKLLKQRGLPRSGRLREHAQLDGVWRDVVIVERLIPENQRA